MPQVLHEQPTNSCSIYPHSTVTVALDPHAKCLEVCNNQCDSSKTQGTTRCRINTTQQLDHHGQQSGHLQDSLPQVSHQPGALWLCMLSIHTEQGPVILPLTCTQDAPCLHLYKVIHMACSWHAHSTPFNSTAQRSATQQTLSVQPMGQNMTPTRPLATNVTSGQVSTQGR